jgi:hypothetical protein
MAKDYKSLESIIRSIVEKKKDDPCWDDYEQIGMKEKNGKEVPNCVPEETVGLEKESIEEKEQIDEAVPLLALAAPVAAQGVRIGAQYLTRQAIRRFATNAVRRAAAAPRRAPVRTPGQPPAAPPARPPARPTTRPGPRTQPQNPPSSPPARPPARPTTRPDPRPQPQNPSTTPPARTPAGPATSPQTAPANAPSAAPRTATNTGNAGNRPNTGARPNTRANNRTPPPPAGGRGRRRSGGGLPGGGMYLPVTDSSAASGAGGASSYMHMADPYIARDINEESDGTVERSKIENVARPSSAREKVVKQQEIQKKIIDETRSLAATVKKNVEETRKREKNSSPIITNPKTNDPDPDGTPGGY